MARSLAFLLMSCAQVISEALQKRGLTCIPIGSTDAAGGLPLPQVARFVCGICGTRTGAGSHRRCARGAYACMFFYIYRHMRACLGAHASA
jgi:hypothetical protein